MYGTHTLMGYSSKTFEVTDTGIPGESRIIHMTNINRLLQFALVHPLLALLHLCPSPGHLFSFFFFFNVCHLLFFPLDLPSVIQLYFFLLYISVTTSLFLLSHDKHCIPLDHMHNTKEVLQLTILIPIMETATFPGSQLSFSLYQLRLSTS